MNTSTILVIATAMNTDMDINTDIVTIMAMAMARANMEVSHRPIESTIISMMGTDGPLLRNEPKGAFNDTVM